MTAIRRGLPDPSYHFFHRGTPSNLPQECTDESIVDGFWTTAKDCRKQHGESGGYVRGPMNAGVLFGCTLHLGMRGSRVINL